ncbi:putative importin-beta domain, armadillo-like helical, exportin-2, central domain-containing protein [Helianthus anomalus]
MLLNRFRFLNGFQISRILTSIQTGGSVRVSIQNTAVTPRNTSSPPLTNPNYALTVFRLIAEPEPSVPVNDHIRLIAAINFKNHLKTHWLTSSPTTIPDHERQQIKQLIVPLMLTCAQPKIQAQVSEALAVIGNHDFPKLWPALLQELKTGLETALYGNDFASVNGILATVNSLEYCLDYFAAPLLSTFETVSAKANAAGSDAAVLGQLIEVQRLCCRIFYSLNKLSGLAGVFRG